ncbi:MAG: hypothetical protein N2V78_09650 [Methanophagales archaeon]|nr:hypothetical protein [Methanophagales archaeon]
MTGTKNMQKTNLIVATFPKSCTGTSDIDISDKKKPNTVAIVVSAIDSPTVEEVIRRASSNFSPFSCSSL